MAVARQYQYLHFLISDSGCFGNATLESITTNISKLLDKTEFNLRKMENCKDFLITLHSQSVPDRNFEDKVMELLEMDGCLVTVIQMEFESMLALNVENTKAIDELMIELQIKDIFKDQAGNTKDIKTFIANKNLLMVLVVFKSHIGDDMLCNDFCLIESLAKVYRVKSSEFVEIYFGKCGMLEDHMEEIWSCDDSDIHNIVTNTFNEAGMISHNKSKGIQSGQEHEEVLDNHVEEIIICDDSDDEICTGETTNESGYHRKNGHQNPAKHGKREFGSHYKTDHCHQNPAKYGRSNMKNWKESKITNPIKEESRTIAVDGEYALEKCHLLQKLCNDLTNKECKLCVDINSKVVTIVGSDTDIQKCLNMILLQIKMFHCEVMKNLNKRLFHLLTQNENVKKHFSSILAENQLDSVLLFEDSLNRPAVLGLNKIKTRNFIEWFENFFFKESIKIQILHIHNLEFRELKRSILLLELNRLVSTDVNNVEILIHGLVTDVLIVADGAKKIMNQMAKRLLLQPPNIQRPQVPTKSASSRQDTNETKLVSPQQNGTSKLTSPLIIEKTPKLTRGERYPRPMTSTFHPSTEPSKTLSFSAWSELSKTVCTESSSSSNNYYSLMPSRQNESLHAKCGNTPTAVPKLINQYLSGKTVIDQPNYNLSSRCLPLGLTGDEGTDDADHCLKAQSKTVDPSCASPHDEVHLTPANLEHFSTSMQSPATMPVTCTLHVTMTNNTPLPSTAGDFASKTTNATCSSSKTSDSMTAVKSYTLTRDKISTMPLTRTSHPLTKHSKTVSPEFSKTVTSTAMTSLSRLSEPSQRACTKLSSSSNHYHNFVSSKGDESLYARYNRPSTPAKTETDQRKRVTSVQKSAHDEVYSTPSMRPIFSPPQIQHPSTVSATHTLHAFRTGNAPLASPSFDFPSARANVGYSTPHTAYKTGTTSAASPSPSIWENRTNPPQLAAAVSPSLMSSQRSPKWQNKDAKKKCVIL